MLLKQLAAEASPAGPGVHMGQFPLFHRSGPDGAEIGKAGGRTDGQHPGILFIPRTEHLNGRFHYGIHPLAAGFPDLFGHDLNQFHFDFFAVVTVQVQKRRMRGFADQAEHVDPKVVKNQGRATHGGDIKTVPAG